MDSKKMKETSSRKIFFFVTTITLVMVATIYYSLSLGRDIATRYTPLVRAAMEIKLGATVAHLWFEEAISGDRTVDIEEVWTLINQSEWYAQAMLDGGTNEEGTFIPLQAPNLRIQIKETIEGIHQFRQIAQQRWVLQSISGIGSDIDQQFDLAFSKFILSADSVEASLNIVIAEDLQTFKFTQRLLIVFTIIFGAVIGGLLLRYNTKIIQTKGILRTSEERYDLAMSATQDGIWDWNALTNESLFSLRWKSMLGYTENEIKDEFSEWERLIHPDDREAALLAVEDFLNNKTKKYETEFRMQHKEGQYINILSRAFAVENEAGKVTRLVGTHVDITQRKQAEEELKLAAIVFSHAREGILITDATTSIIKVNNTFTEMTGYSREELIGQKPSMLKSGRQSKQFYTDMWQTINTLGYWSGELWNRRKNGEVFAEFKNISAVHDANGVIQNYVAICSDITSMKEHQGQLERNAHYDVLTTLPNRVLLSDRLNQAMVHSERHHSSLAVIFLDLDGFKAVNDAYGHDVGDELLIALSHRMKEALREGDTLSRFGGDEFVSVLADLTKVEDCKPVLERLLQAAASPIAIDGTIIQVSASIGVAIYPQDNADAGQLMRHADKAMYLAKKEGKNCYRFFDTKQDETNNTKRENLGNIRSALERNEFELHYQPKVNMHDGEVVGVEALIRWQHPVHGLVAPLDFLPIIEGHIISLDVEEWVIDTALTQISQWQDMGIYLPVSVNISALQLQKNDFVICLAALLAAHPEVNPSALELEILETSALSDISQVTVTMNACRDLGIRFALDDFGTGYSSLTYLRNLPVHLIKIDQSFVRNMLEDVDDLAIVEGVVGLAKTFKRDVIAEGVETIEHGTALLELGCELAQGYGIARPMPADDIPAWVIDWKPDDAWRRVDIK